MLLNRWMYMNGAQRTYIFLVEKVNKQKRFFLYGPSTKGLVNVSVNKERESAFD
jgi:hypothetical protein